MTKIVLKLMPIVMLISVLVLQSCTTDGGSSVIVDDDPPAAPRGVHSVTGDGSVTLYWYPNQESDLDGYVIYRGLNETGDYVEIATVGAEPTNYVDRDVENGVTYYYAVSAFDLDGNESDLSPEIVDDTPRPEGRGVTLRDYIMRPNSSGFDFLRADKGAQRYSASGVDFYFGVGTVDNEFSVPYIYAADDNIGIQDLGYTDTMDDVDVSPEKGFTFGFAEAITGHTYAFLTLEGNYAKIRITDVKIDWAGNEIRDAWMTFDWAYQLQTDNPELAPGRATVQMHNSPASANHLLKASHYPSITAPGSRD